MQIEIKLDINDWKIYQSYMEKTLPQKLDSWMNSFWFNLIFWMLLTIIFMVIFQQYSEFHWPTALLLGLIFVLLVVTLVFNSIKLRKSFEPSDNGVFCGTHIFTFSETGIDTESKVYKGTTSWSAIKRIERKNGLIMLFIDTAYAYIIPEKKVENANDLYNYIKNLADKYTSS